MPTAIVTGSGGLVGSEAARFFAAKQFTVAGIDNDMRKYFFGDEASTAWSIENLKSHISDYRHHSIDIRDTASVERVFAEYASDVSLIVHTAAQPSHDWAAREPLTDFGVNANGTLNVLEAARKHCPDAVFIFTSTNKVYGDRPNHLPLVESVNRWTIDFGHEYANGITETMPIDSCMHSIMGASKVAADIMVQEYGRYFGMKTVCFRGGCLTGPGHSGAELHGFLAYLMKCCVIGREYQVIGYKGKQVRDNIHSADLIEAFWQFYQAPRAGEVYNIGGGVYSNVSLLEAIALAEEIAGKKMITTYREQPRTGDHIWWIGGMRKFQSHYPDWRVTRDIRATMEAIYRALVERTAGH